MEGTQCARMSLFRAPSRESVRATMYCIGMDTSKSVLHVPWRECSRAMKFAQEAFA
jgi:hypothetical protein